MQRALCSLSGKPLAPMRPRQSPQYLYAWRYGQVIPRDVQSYTSNQFARFLDFSRPCPPPAPRDEARAVIRHGVAFLTRHWFREMRHDNGISVECREGPAIQRPPLPQKQPLRLEFDRDVHRLYRIKVPSLPAARRCAGALHVIEPACSKQSSAHADAKRQSQVAPSRSRYREAGTNKCRCRCIQWSL